MKKTIRDISVRGKKVFIRVDYNVPLNEKGDITDDIRIRESLATINYLLEKGCALVLSSHLGRPKKGKDNSSFSLRPVASHLEKLLNKKVLFAQDCIDETSQEMKKNLETGQILLLENVRFYDEEIENDLTFAKKLIAHCEVFVNDAFGTAHRAHASTTGVAQFVTDAVSGFLIEKELQYLSAALDTAKRPFTAIIGGAKISGKIDVINQLFKKVDTIIIGGAMAFTFLKAMGFQVGKSLVEDDKLDLANALLEQSKHSQTRFLLPSDIICADDFSNQAKRSTCDADKIPNHVMGLDIGPKTVRLFQEIIVNSKTIIWNGPMGAFEMSNFAEGTRQIAMAMVKATDSGAITIVGGGDSAAAIQEFNVADKVSHVSTGGGASLELLEGKLLPGIECLDEA